MKIIRENKTPRSLKLLILICSAIICCIALIYLIKTRIAKSAYFNINRIVMRGGADIAPPSYLLGKNLFSVDLKRVEKKLFFDYPKLRSVDILRSLPDVLVINAEERLPILKIKLNLAVLGKARSQKKLFFLDSDAVVLDAPLIKKYKNLPEIFGLTDKIKKFHVGEKLENDNLAAALTLLKEYNKTDNLRSYEIEHIDMSDPDETFFEILVNPFNPSKRSGRRPERNKLRIKVIIGKNETGKRVKMLSLLLPKIRSNLKKVKYIDLRFHDPVTGAK